MECATTVSLKENNEFSKVKKGSVVMMVVDYLEKDRVQLGSVSIGSRVFIQGKSHFEVLSKGRDEVVAIRVERFIDEECLKFGIGKEVSVLTFPADRDAERLPIIDNPSKVTLGELCPDCIVNIDDCLYWISHFGADVVNGEAVYLRRVVKKYSHSEVLPSTLMVKVKDITCV